MTGLPSASFLKSWPAESTSIFCSKVCVRVPRLPLPPGVLPEIRTSTCMPGTTKPATPTTSLTRTATARIPGGIMAAIPPPAPLGARRDSMIGSLAKMVVMTPRPRMSLICVVDPGGMAPGQSASLTSPSFNTVPTSRSLVASASCASVALAVVVAGRLISTRYSTKLAPAATRNAKVKTPTNLLFIWIPASPDSIYRRRLPENTGHGRPGTGLAATRLRLIDTFCTRCGLPPVPKLVFPGHAGNDRKSAGMPREALAGRRVRSRELAVRRRPDAFDVVSGAQEKSRRSQRHKCHEQGIFDEILALFVSPEIAQKRHCVRS